MSRVSVIIPARKEKYLVDTINDLYSQSTGQIEVIVVLDGRAGHDYKMPEHPRLKVVQNKYPQGMRSCVNDAAKVATGKYLMKIDAHCKIDEDWDKVLQDDCEDNWVVIPKRFHLDAPTGDIDFDPPVWNVKIPPNGVEAMSYLYPFLHPYSPYLTCRPDRERAEAQREEMLVKDMGFAGSCWFMTKAHFNRIGGMDAHKYGGFGQEPDEIGLKTQLGPWKGSVMRNKNIWYAHWSKPQSHWAANPVKAGRVTDEEFAAVKIVFFDYWWNNRWNDGVRDFEWLVDEFWPLPGWPKNWRWEYPQFTRYEVTVPERI